MSKKKRKDILIDYKLMDRDFTAFHRGTGIIDKELEVIEDILGVSFKPRKRKSGR